MPVQTLAFAPSDAAPIHAMISAPGGTFRMGSDHHYPEEAPGHRVTVDSFLVNRAGDERAVQAIRQQTCHVTFAEIVPDPKDYPGSLRHMILPARRRSGAFTPRRSAQLAEETGARWLVEGNRRCSAVQTN
jgi:hypothetical protein